MVVAVLLLAAAGAAQQFRLGRVEQVQAHRRLSSDEKAEIQAFLVGKPKGRVGVQSISANVESDAYANEWAEQLREAGWNAERTYFTPVGPAFRGIRVLTRSPFGGDGSGYVKPGDLNVSTVLLFQLAKKVTGLDPTLTPDENGFEAILDVGLKP